MSVNSAATASAPGCDAGARWTAGLAQADGSVFAPAPWSVWWTLAADLPAPIASAPSGVTVLFQPVALEQFPAWLAAETARLRRAGDSLPTGPAGAAGAAGPRLFPRLELPVGERTRQFLKNIDHAALAAWLDACAVDLSGRAAATGRAAPAAPGPSGVLLIAAADYARTALDLRHLLARHDPRKGPQAGRAPLALLLDDFACDQACQAQAGIRLGDHYPVYLLARGLPGAALDEQGRAPEALAAETLQRAEDLYHLAVGELGTERILFGTGLTAAAAPAEVAAQAATRAALAAWFRRPRAWLDSDSAELLFAANANRLAAC